MRSHPITVSPIRLRCSAHRFGPASERTSPGAGRRRSLARDRPRLIAFAAAPGRRHGDDLCQGVDDPALAEWTQPSVAAQSRLACRMLAGSRRGGCSRVNNRAMPGLRRMRRAVFGDPLRAHPPEIALGATPGNSRLVDDQRGTDCDESCDGEPHGRDASALAPVMASIVPDRAARVCAVMHICARSEGASDSGPPSSGVSLVG